MLKAKNIFRRKEIGTNFFNYDEDTRSKQEEQQRQYLFEQICNVINDLEARIETLESITDEEFATSKILAELKSLDTRVTALEP